MIYKFNIKCKKEDTNFLRIIEISEDDNFFSFYKIIHQCVNYDNSQMTSFFVSNDDWERFEEITLMDMGVKSKNIYVMHDTSINQFIKKVGDKLIYLFDFFSERYFKIELIDIIDKKLKPNSPVCINEKGTPPKQLIIDDSIDDVNLDFNDEDLYDNDNNFENIDDIEDL